LGPISKKNRTPEYQYKTICQKITDINEIEYEQLQLEDILSYNLTSVDLGSADMFQLNLGQLFVNYAYNLRENRLKTWENQEHGTLTTASILIFVEVKIYICCQKIRCSKVTVSPKVSFYKLSTLSSDLA